MPDGLLRSCLGLQTQPRDSFDPDVALVVDRAFVVCKARGVRINQRHRAFLKRVADDRGGRAGRVPETGVEVHREINAAVCVELERIRLAQDDARAARLEHDRRR